MVSACPLQPPQRSGVRGPDAHFEPSSTSTDLVIGVFRPHAETEYDKDVLYSKFGWAEVLDRLGLARLC